jgi:hypothetical protein
MCASRASLNTTVIPSGLDVSATFRLTAKSLDG